MSSRRVDHVGFNVGHIYSSTVQAAGIARSRAVGQSATCGQMTGQHVGELAAASIVDRWLSRGINLIGLLQPILQSRQLMAREELSIGFVHQHVHDSAERLQAAKGSVIDLVADRVGL